MSSTRLIVSNPWTLIENKLICNKEEISRDRLVKIAQSELREDENTRKQCLEQLRDWIRRNEDIENCVTEDTFLLRFLRSKKFSIPMAEQTLLKYLNFRKRFKEVMVCLDYLNSDLVNKGFVFASPFRDTNGRRVIIYNLSTVDPQKHDGTDIFRAQLITYETLLNDEENQIIGFNHVADLKGLTAAFLTLYPITEFARIIRWGEQSLPMRHKEFNILNLSPAFRYVYEFVRSNIRSSKLQERIVIHSKLSDLHKKVDKRCLPSEMGGVMPAKQMIELWKEELAAKREVLLSYDRMNLLSDKGIISSKNSLTSDDIGTGSLPGCFRKLEVD